MRILYYCPEYYYRHGGRTHARGFFNALKLLPSVSACYLYPKKNPHRIDVNREDNNQFRDKLWFLPKNIRKIIRFFMPRRAITKALINEIKINKCDALIIRTGVGLPSINNIKLNCPEVTICLEVNSAYIDETFEKLFFKKKLEHYEVDRYLNAHCLTVVSSYLKQYLVDREISSEKILINHNGVDIKAINDKQVKSMRKYHDIPQDAFVIGYIGGMERFRRLPEVIKYVSDLRGMGNDDIYLIVVGDGEDKHVVQSVIRSERAHLRNAVKLMGWQKYTDIPKYLKMFDLAIFPFTNDYCSPLKLFEYLAAGIPTIGPNTSAVREVFEDGRHLKLVEQDGSNFIQTILAIKSDEELQNKLSRAGKKLVQNDYTWEKNAQRVITHIKNNRICLKNSIVENG